MASGWNLWLKSVVVVIRWWVWLECIGVVSGCRCKEVYRYLHITYSYSTCISSFFAAASLLLCSLTLGAHAPQG